MKTLIIIIVILFSINCNGQDSNTGFYSTAEGEAVTINLKDQFIINPSDLFVTHIDVFIVIKHFEDYEKYCYNDSTLIDVYIDPNTINEIAPGIYITTLMAGYYKKQWVHKEPTFKDFIKWIKKQ